VRGPSTIVVGAGVFGAAAALELRRRGHAVWLLDPAPLPNPRGATADVSKFVRMDYGADDLYTDLAEESLARWDAWNARAGERLYVESGLAVMRRDAMGPGGFEYESFVRLERRGVAVRRMSPEALARRFPAWTAERYADGYFNPRAGWAASALALSRLLDEARAAGVDIREGARLTGFLERGSRVAGVRTVPDGELEADHVVVAAGAWTPQLVPHLADRLWVSAQPICYFRVAEPAEFQPPRFSCWTADISRTGWYGFPALDDGTVKVANHGPGRRVDPDGSREVAVEDVERCRAFLSETFPGLAGAPLVASRTCLYCDSWDGNFYVDHDPDRPGLVVAAGDSGHGFKFAPVLGELIADVLERRPNRYAARFAWRELGPLSAEDARYTGGSR
jgi:glycine/D-amino acid oxidase-like deaminating enzyme